MECLLRRTYDAAELFANHPPIWRDPNKQVVFDTACPAGSTHHGRIEVTRWRAVPLPLVAELAPTEIVPIAGFYDYRDGDGETWHVNFADPRLFFAYAGLILAQDELQAVEHPALGAIREALLAEGIDPLTDDDVPTPVLVAGAERRCELDTTSLYGNHFSRAPAAKVRAAVRLIDPPTRSNLIALAAPQGHGTYWRQQLETIIITALTGFVAAKRESAGRPIEVCTGFWGCGAFGGNRRLMTALQILAARLAGVAKLRFYGGTDLAPFHAGVADLASCVRAHAEPLGEIIDRIDDLAYEWGVGDGT